MGWYYDSHSWDDGYNEPSYTKPAKPVDRKQLNREDKDAFDEVANIPHRLKRQFRLWDVFKGHDLSNLRWDVIGLTEDLGPGKSRRRSKPPPPDDPRTQLPDIFKFQGWNRYGSPDFQIYEVHPTCYPRELVERLRVLHGEGVGGRREEGVVYVVTREEGDSTSDSGCESDSDAEDEDETTAGGTNGGEVLKTSRVQPIEDIEDELRSIECVGTYETLEMANDAAMSLFEKEFRENLIFQQSSYEDDYGTPDFNLGLHRILPEGLEDKLPYDGEIGATWRLTQSGCLKLTGYEDGEVSMFAVTRKEVGDEFC